MITRHVVCHTCSPPPQKKKKKSQNQPTNQQRCTSCVNFPCRFLHFCENKTCLSFLWQILINCRKMGCAKYITITIIYIIAGVAVVVIILIFVAIVINLSLGIIFSERRDVFETASYHAFRSAGEKVLPGVEARL